MVDHEHCPHSIEREHSDQWKEVCCICGMTRQATLAPRPIAGHGPYLPEWEAETAPKYTDWQ